jgi:HTH-type transcriptional regulator, sugar sensing transcriptional regulator
MEAKTEFLQKLKQDFKLNIYEVKIWTAILTRGIATAGELADISGVPRSRCYDVLESLEKKGFIIMKIGKPIKYIAVQPEEIVERVKKEVTDTTSTQCGVIESIKDSDVFKELELLHKTGVEHIDATELSHGVVGRDEAYHFLKGMVDKAKKSVVIHTTEEGFVRKVNLLKNVIKGLKKKGVKVTINAPVNDKIAKKLENTAVLNNVKNASRYVIVDNQELFFMTTMEDTNPSYDSAVWVKSPYFVSALQGLRK